MPDRPTGPVTFLFTDIEGSTTRWEQQRQAMQAALARHDAILRTAIQAHGGHVFKTVGDAFYAVFAAAPDALHAALAAQRAFESEAWPAETGPLPVRMALHTGATEQRDGDYFGHPLNRVAVSPGMDELHQQIHVANREGILEEIARLRGSALRGRAGSLLDHV